MINKHPLSKFHYINFPLSQLQIIWDNPEKGIQIIIVTGAADLAARFYPDESRFCLIYKLLSHWGFSWDSNTGIEELLKTCQRELNSFESKYSKDVYVNLPVKSIHNLINQQVTIEEFCCICAIKSLIGQKIFVSTTKDAITRRMFGCKNSMSFDVLCQEKPEILKIAEKTSKRYHFDKLLNSLEVEGCLKARVGTNRKIYLSLSKSTQELKKILKVP